MKIDCERCPNRVGDDPCDDCLVTFLLSLEDGSALVEADEISGDGQAVLDAAEARAVRALSEGGLVRAIRLTPRKRAG